jgi:hypothetical protein
MKKPFLLLLLMALIAGSFSFTLSSTVDKRTYDKSDLINYLKATRDSALNAVQGLSDTQMSYKEAPDRWSVAECLEHITLVEKNFITMAKSMAEEKPNPERSHEIKITDEAIVQGVSDRSHKVKAPEPFIPRHAFASKEELIKAFTDQRNELISYVESTNDNLRDHIKDMPPFGPISEFQVLLLDGAHSARHTKQMREVMASAEFPKQ